MYKIIGGDGQEYGPVTDADLRQWIAEGRLNPQSLAKSESDAEFRPLSTFPEFAEAFGGAASAHPAFAAEMDWNKRDYELDIGGCISRGWNLFTNNAGIMIGSTLLFIVIIIGVSLAITLPLNAALLLMVPRETFDSAPFKIGNDFGFRIVSTLVFGPLTGGLYYLFIRLVRGEPAGVGDLFAGFQRTFLQLFLGYLVFTLVTALCFLFYNIVELSRLAPLLAQMQHGASPEQMQKIMPELISSLVGTIPVFLVCLVPAIYLVVNLQFVVPLIIDKQMDFWTAIKTAWKMVHKHWFTVFGLFLVLGLINILGLLLCCVGFLFITLPMTTAAQMIAYETIFCEPKNV